MARSTLPGLGSEALKTLVFRKFRGQRILYQALLAVTGSILFLLPLTEITVYSTLKGMLQHANSSITLKATDSGRIDSIFSGNEQVQAGDTLMIINHDDIRYQLQRIDDQLKRLMVENTSLTNLINGKAPGSKAPIHVASQYRQFQTRKKKREAQYQSAHEKSERARILFDRSVLSKSEWEGYKYRLQQSLIALEEYDRSSRREWAETISANNRIMANLKRDSLILEEKRKSAHIVSPASGRVTGIEDHNKGQWIHQGQEVAQLRTDTPLKFWCYVTPDVFSEINEMPQAVVRFPGLKSWEHTYHDARLDYDAARPDTATGTFLYRIPGTIVLDPPYDPIRKKLIAGLPLVVLVKINHHRLYDLLFEKIPGKNIRLFFQKPTVTVN